MNRLETWQTESIGNIVESLENTEMKDLANLIVENLPEYWYTVPASSSGKYHPLMSIGEGGLFRHSLAVETFMEHFLTIDQYKNKFSSQERDALKIAALFHDGEKHGKSDSGGHTIFEHPLCMAKTIQGYKGTIDNVSDEIIDFIADCISSHMGQWTTDKRSPNVMLPTPQTLGQELVHLADYLASRKNIEIHFEQNVKFEKPTKEKYVFTFGKHKGKSFMDVVQKDKGYIAWLKENYHREPLKSFLKEV